MGQGWLFDTEGCSHENHSFGLATFKFQETYTSFITTGNSVAAAVAAAAASHYSRVLPAYLQSNLVQHGHCRGHTALQQQQLTPHILSVHTSLSQKLTRSCPCCCLPNAACVSVCACLLYLCACLCVRVCLCCLYPAAPHLVCPAAHAAHAEAQGG
jgi:hypothetical protein